MVCFSNQGSNLSRNSRHSELYFSNTDLMIATTQMEATFCRAYNASKGRRLGLRITVADCAGEPFKLMKVILDGLAQNAEAAFWLTNLHHSPQIVRIFPLDFAYLDADLNILEGVELPPGIPLPKFHPQATSALILPLNFLAANKTGEGDQLIICSEEDFDLRLAELDSSGESQVSSTSAAEEPTEPATDVELGDASDRTFGKGAFFTPQTTVPIQPPTLGPGSGFTLALAGGWRVATTTTASLALEAVESAVGEEEGAKVELQVSDQTSETGQTDQSDLGSEEDAAGISGSPADAEHPESGTRHTIDLTKIGVHERALAKVDLGEPSTSRTSTAVSDQATSDSDAAKAQRSTDELIARSKEAAEKSYVKVGAPTGPASSKPKRKAQQKADENKKEHLGNRVVRWLALDDPLPERRKIIRLVLQGLQAYEANGDSTKRYDVRDICPPGLFICTDEPWQQGDALSLVLVKKGATDNDHEHRVSIQARVVRRDDDGVGIAFVFPEGTEFQPWQRAKTKRSDESEADFILRELRLARALGFLRRLCPWSADEVNHSLLDRFSNKRVTSAVEITLKAEEILHRRGHVAQPFVASDLLIRILEGGSWIDEDWIRRMWGGLLVSSCSADGQDRTNFPFIDLLARLTPIHLRILSFVCHRGVEALAAGESEAALDLYSTAAELMEAADSHSFPRIQQTIGQLASVGLLAETARSSYADMSDRSRTRTTPTSLGLRMFARCNGEHL